MKIKKSAWYIAIVSALVVLGPASLPAQEKIRIAIWEFENHSEGSWWFSGDLGPAARNQIDTAFSEDATLSATFSVIERDQLALVLKEQGLATAGALDPRTAAELGKILGIRYIVTGGIDKFAINNTRGGIARLGVGGNMVQAEATINMRFIDTTTAERVVSISASGEVRKGGGFIRGTSLSREDEWGIASETIETTSKDIVAKLLSGDYLNRVSTAAAPVAAGEGLIIKVDGNTAFINLGSSSGVKVGDTFTIVSVGEALVDPVTGANLGALEEESGTAQVTQVQEKFAVVTVTGTAKIKDVVRRQ